MTFTRRNSLKTSFSLMLFLLISFNLQAGMLPDFTGLVEQYAPAVVNISTRQNVRPGNSSSRGFSMPEFPEGSPFNEFFRRFLDDFTLDEFGGTNPHGNQVRSLGSGFIISSDGYILTNHHVVKDADEVIVRLKDRREFIAEVVGSDRQSDTAILKIDAKDLPVVRIGKGADLKVGEWVLAIGSPFGFDHTVTAGIVSAKGRSLPNENYVPFIQTDVAINPGNSGGPLFNLDGEVVGVNSQIYSQTGSYMGLSFAIPIETAMNVSRQLRANGRVSRGWLGVVIQNVDRELAESFGMRHPRGALVSQVLEDSPAEAAGLHTGDIILAFNGHQVLNSAQLPPIVGVSPVDKPAKVEILRNGEHKILQVRLGELPDDEVELAAIAKKKALKSSNIGLLGLHVVNLTKKQQAEWKLNHGVLVMRIEPGPAYAAGIRKGDIILKLNNEKVQNQKKFGKIVSNLPKGKSVAILVERDSGPMFLALRLP